MCPQAELLDTKYFLKLSQSYARNGVGVDKKAPLKRSFLNNILSVI
jgi:hypothetical protein